MVSRTEAKSEAMLLLLWGFVACSDTVSVESNDGADAALDKAVEWYSPTIRSWVTGCGTGEDLWRFRLSTTVQCDERGTQLVGEGDALEWPVDLDAGVIDGLIVFGERLDEIDFRLSWTGEESFSDDRSETAYATSLPDSDNAFFDLRSEAEWQGTIRRLRLEWSGASPQRTWLHGVRVGGAG